VGSSQNIYSNFSASLFFSFFTTALIPFSTSAYLWRFRSHPTLTVVVVAHAGENVSKTSSPPHALRIWYWDTTTDFCTVCIPESRKAALSYVGLQKFSNIWKDFPQFVCRKGRNLKKGHEKDMKWKFLQLSLCSNRLLSFSTLIVIVTRLNQPYWLWQLQLEGY